MRAMAWLVNLSFMGKDHRFWEGDECVGGREFGACLCCIIPLATRAAQGDHAVVGCMPDWYPLAAQTRLKI
jgi:hypothetical protein